MSNDRIGLAQLSDLESITNIYNQAICAKTCTCDIELLLSDERASWFSTHQNELYPIFVYKRDDEIVGYSYISPYREGRKALQSVGEISYYVDFRCHRQGIGYKLVAHTITKAKNIGYQNLLAIVLECNIGSISLLEKFGFIRWGYFPKIAVIDGDKHSHLYYGKPL